MKQIRKTLVYTALLLTATLTGCAQDKPASESAGQTNVPIAQQTEASGTQQTDAPTATTTEVQTGKVVAEGTCGENLTWTLDENGLLIISGSGEIEFRNEESPWPKGKICYVHVSEGVTSIGFRAFADCESLTSVTIPDSVTSIGKDAFARCYSLTSVTIPDSVTSIGFDAFRACESLTSVTIPSSVTSIGDGAFSGCLALPDIQVSLENPNYSSLNGVLYNKAQTELLCCPAGKTDTAFAIPDSVTSIGEEAFLSCTSLASVTIPDSVTSIGHCAFSSCESLTSVTIPDSVTSIGIYAFAGCLALPDIQVSLENPNYSSLNGVLYNKAQTELLCCPAGKTDTAFAIPDSVTSIGFAAFACCTSLTSVTIPSSVTSIGSDAFYGCRSLTSVTIPDSVTSIGEDAFRDCESLTSVTIPDRVTSIDEYAFSGCESLVIHAPAGSYAETFAKDHNILFEPH